MQCNTCPLFSSWNNESDSGEACALLVMVGIVNSCMREIIRYGDATLKRRI